MLGLRKDGVEGGDQSGHRAAVLGQGVGRCDVAGRLEVGEDVRPAKPVDRLLGVTDQKERPLPVGKQPRKNRDLQLVGVLELVDENRPVFAPDGFDQAACRRRCRRRPGHPQQQVVEGLDIALQLSALEL